MQNDFININDLLYRTDQNKIYLTSDWHLFKNHYKKEKNLVNTKNIITWCRQNINDDDIFIYLGDICYRFANETDKKESQKIISSIPGIKILILGNHDIMLGKEYYDKCGFIYVYNTLIWNNILFSHKPINIEFMPVDINIHGHMHNIREYNTCDGSNNINVYPFFYNNKPVTLEYCLNNKDELVKDNKRSNWIGMEESTKYIQETKRSNLPDSAFGIPEDRKYPLDSKKHVISAIKLFNHAEESKKQELLKRIKKAAKKFSIPIDDKLNKIQESTIPVIANDKLEYADCEMIKYWYVSCSPALNNNHNEYYNNIKDAVLDSINFLKFDDNNAEIQEYVFTIDRYKIPTCLGQINVKSDGTWSWIYQYPISINGNSFINDTKINISEWAMSNCNPIVGIHKPFILKMKNEYSGTLNANTYVFSPDIISDKYLVINEDAKLEFIDANKLNDMIVEEYEFIGDKRSIKKIETAYLTGKTVDNTFFYTALTNKPMLTEDQIDFDDNFKKVDFISIKESELTRMATMNESLLSIINNNVSIDAMPNSYIKSLLQDKDYIKLKEDLNGYYLYNTYNGKRTESIYDQDLITEQMLYSILKGGL